MHLALNADSKTNNTYNAKRMHREEYLENNFININIERIKHSMYKKE